MASYDLRSNAKTKGNRPYLPPKYVPLMHLGYLSIILCILASVGYFGWGMWLKYQIDAAKGEASQYQQQVKVQDNMLWLAEWHSQSVPFQELLVQLFQELPEEAKLSHLSLRHNSADGMLDFRVAINSDRVTSAQYFREITNFFTSRGLSVTSFQQNQVVGATVFDAKLKIMRRLRSTEVGSPGTPADPGN